MQGKSCLSRAVCSEHPYQDAAIKIKMMHIEQATACTLGHYLGQKVAVSPYVLTCALQTGAQQAFAHVKAVVHLFVPYALQASGVGLAF